MALSGTEGVSLGMEVIKASSDTEAVSECMQVIMALGHVLVFVIFDRN
jgi:hypothetical protein